MSRKKMIIGYFYLCFQLMTSVLYGVASDETTEIGEVKKVDVYSFDRAEQERVESLLGDIDFLLSLDKKDSDFHQLVLNYIKLKKELEVSSGQKKNILEKALSSSSERIIRLIKKTHPLLLKIPHLANIPTGSLLLEESTPSIDDCIDEKLRNGINLDATVLRERNLRKEDKSNADDFSTYIVLIIQMRKELTHMGFNIDNIVGLGNLENEIAKETVKIYESRNFVVAKLKDLKRSCLKVYAMIKREKYWYTLDHLFNLPSDLPHFEYR